MLMLSHIGALLKHAIATMLAAMMHQQVHLSRKGLMDSHLGRHGIQPELPVKIPSMLN